MYAFRTRHGPADLCFTDRSGGDLAFGADGTAPAPAAGRLRRRGPSCATSCRCTARTSPSSRRSRPWPVRQADALVTREPDVVLMVRAADCVPVLFHAPEIGAVGAAHCGRLGLRGRGGPANRRAAARGGATRASPRGSGPTSAAPATRCPSEMQQEVAAAVPAARATTSWGTPSLDLGAGVRAQLEAAGVAVEDVSRCTRESPTSTPTDATARPRGGTRAWSGCEVAGERPAPRAARRAGAGASSGSRSACADAGRDPDEVQLVVVTKTFPASDVRLLAELGVTDVAENKQQELSAKRLELRARRPAGAMALRRTAPEQQGRLGRRCGRRGALGRPGQAAGAHGPARPCPRRAAPGEPRPARQRTPRRRGTLGPHHAGGRGRRVRAPHASRADGRRTPGRRPARRPSSDSRRSGPGSSRRTPRRPGSPRA